MNLKEAYLTIEKLENRINDLTIQVKQATNGLWLLVENDLPKIEEIVFLDNGKQTWIGGRSDVGCDEWLFGCCYSNIWYNRNTQKWEGEIEIDDEYEPISWCRIPKPKDV